MVAAFVAVRALACPPARRHPSMTSKRAQDPDDSGRPGDKRTPDHDDEAPAWRPDDEVPATRREAPQRGDRNDDEEHRDRRGS